MVKVIEGIAKETEIEAINIRIEAPEIQDRCLKVIVAVVIVKV